MLDEGTTWTGACFGTSTTTGSASSPRRPRSAGNASPCGCSSRTRPTGWSASGYGRHVAEAAATDWDVEALTREEAIGLIVLLDQFPRNIHRTTGDAFAHDGVARDVARRLVAGGLDRFAYMERFLIALPFQHSEDVADQDYGVLLIAEMAVNGPESVREF